MKLFHLDFQRRPKVGARPNVFTRPLCQSQSTGKSLQIQPKTNWQVVIVPTIQCGSTFKCIQQLKNIFIFATVKNLKANSYPTANFADGFTFLRISHNLFSNAAQPTRLSESSPSERTKSRAIVKVNNFWSLLIFSSMFLIFSTAPRTITYAFMFDKIRESPFFRDKWYNKAVKTNVWPPKSSTLRLRKHLGYAFLT